jgi:hypothetical protein
VTDVQPFSASLAHDEDEHDGHHREGKNCEADFDIDGQHDLAPVSSRS